MKENGAYSKGRELIQEAAIYSIFNIFPDWELLIFY